MSWDFSLARTCIHVFFWDKISHMCMCTHVYTHTLHNLKRGYSHLDLYTGTGKHRIPPKSKSLSPARTGQVQPHAVSRARSRKAIGAGMDVR